MDDVDKLILRFYSEQIAPIELTEKNVPAYLLNAGLLFGGDNEYWHSYNRVYRLDVAGLLKRAGNKKQWSLFVITEKGKKVLNEYKKELEEKKGVLPVVNNNEGLQIIGDNNNLSSAQFDFLLNNNSKHIANSRKHISDNKKTTVLEKLSWIATILAAIIAVLLFILKK